MRIRNISLLIQAFNQLFNNFTFVTLLNWFNKSTNYSTPIQNLRRKAQSYNFSIYHISECLYFV